jgi:hypothetical protein
MDSVELKKNVFAHFGAAIYQAQCLEQEIIIAIMLVEHLPKAYKGYESKKNGLTIMTSSWQISLPKQWADY